MQYQVYKADTKEIVAWIDTDDPKKGAVLRKGYEVRAGEDLRAFADNEEAVTDSIYAEEREEEL